MQLHLRRMLVDSKNTQFLTAPFFLRRMRLLFALCTLAASGLREKNWAMTPCILVASASRCGQHGLGQRCAMLSDVYHSFKPLEV